MRRQTAKAASIHRFLVWAGVFVFVLSLSGGAAVAQEAVTTTTTVNSSAPLFSVDPYLEAKVGSDSHPYTDPLDLLLDDLGYVTRGGLAMRLADVLGLEPSNASYFKDVIGPEECFSAVGALSEKKLLAGSRSSEFHPDELVSRAQALVWIIDALGYKLDQDADSKVPFRFSFFDSPSTWLGGFKDRELVDAALARGVANAYRLGVIDVPSHGCLYPSLPLTEKDLKSILDRAFVRTVKARTAPPKSVAAQPGYPLLELKAEGDLVWYLEYRLSVLKYRPGPIDGVFDVRTRDAVYAFQKVERLKKDGAVGDTFWKELATAQTPTPKRQEGGTRVEVDLGRQVLFMITDNKVWKVMHISSGKSTTQTLWGDFVIEKKIPSWLHDSYQTTMYYSSFFDVDHRLAFHGYSQVPTWAASHGCVRTPNWMAKELYEEMSMGMRVYIYK